MLKFWGVLLSILAICTAHIIIIYLITQYIMWTAQNMKLLTGKSFPLPILKPHGPKYSKWALPPISKGFLPKIQLPITETTRETSLLPCLATFFSSSLSFFCSISNLLKFLHFFEHNLKLFYAVLYSSVVVRQRNVTASHRVVPEWTGSNPPSPGIWVATDLSQKRLADSTCWSHVKDWIFYLCLRIRETLALNGL